MSDEVNALIHLLHSQGVSYLMGSDRSSGQDKETTHPVHLLRRLAACNFPFVENAIISLLLLHPELASSVEAVLQESDPELAENLAVATLYLQQWWFFSSGLRVWPTSRFSRRTFTSLWENRDLPPPSSGYGRDGFLALQSYQQRRYGFPLNSLVDWQNQIDHLLTQEEAHQRPLLADTRKTLLQQSA